MTRSGLALGSAVILLIASATGAAFLALRFVDLEGQVLQLAPYSAPASKCAYPRQTAFNGGSNVILGYGASPFHLVPGVGGDYPSYAIWIDDVTPRLLLRVYDSDGRNVELDGLWYEGGKVVPQPRVANRFSGSAIRAGGYSQVLMPAVTRPPTLFAVGTRTTSGCLSFVFHGLTNDWRRDVVVQQAPNRMRN